ncbi:MAG: transporter [Chitinophagales bacterium]|nr:transporter [Chitinophagales bacterium]
MENNSTPSAAVKLKEDDNTGLSTKVQSRNQRSIREDGSFNIEHVGLPFVEPSDIFQSLITMSWKKFNLLVFLTYLLVNTIFAIIYFFIGGIYFTNTDMSTPWRTFLDEFFFSAQSLTTVGYGRVAPIGIFASAVAAFESMVGLLGFALATGLLYGRFSRPKAKVVSSKNILMSPYKEGRALMFRIANGRKTQLIEAEVSVTLSKIAIEKGTEIRRFYPLELERKFVSMFPTAWVVVHPIDELSPLYNKTKDDFIKEDMEVLIAFKAYDETFSNNVHHRISYRAEDLVWGAKFIINYEQKPDGKTVHYINKVSDFSLNDLPAQPTRILTGAEAQLASNA